MGVDSSDYEFRNSETLETILRLASNAYGVISDPKLRISIRSTQKENIQEIVKTIKGEFINYGMYFLTSDLSEIRSKLIEHNDAFKIASITLANSSIKESGSTSLKYDKRNKDTFAWIGLPLKTENELLNQLTNFLNAINEYSEFGPEDEREVKEFAKTIYSLNQQIRNSDKWKYETGCIEFEPVNDRKEKNSESRNRSMSGLKVQFSKIHSMAYKAKGIADLAKILIRDRNLIKAKFHINSEVKSSIEVIDSVSIEEIECYLYYTLNSFENIKELDWIIANNECTIELCDCKFSKEDEFEFSLCLSGNSIDNLDVNLFIDYQASKEYKNKVLDLFEDKMHHVGDG